MRTYIQTGGYIISRVVGEIPEHGVVGELRAEDVG